MLIHTLNLSNFFKDGESKGLICYSKEWLDFISKLDQEKFIDLKIFLLCTTNDIKNSGGKKTYTTRKTGDKIRYVDIIPNYGVKRTLKVPEFPGFDEFICQMHIGAVDLSLDEITEYAQKLKLSAEREESQEKQIAEIVKTVNKNTKADKA